MLISGGIMICGAILAFILIPGTAGNRVLEASHVDQPVTMSRSSLDAG